MRRKIQKPGKLGRESDAAWNWRKNYRVWDANRCIFLYPENWIEPEMRLPAPFRISLGELALFIRARCGAKGVRILFAGKDRASRLVTAQTMARNLGKDLFRIDLGAVVSEYIGETEKNLRRVFRAAKDGHVVLFFDEADALFGKRTNVKNSHDRYANIEIDYLLRRSDKHADLTILATGNRAGTDKAFMRRFHIVIRIPERRKPRRKRFITC